MASSCPCGVSSPTTVTPEIFRRLGEQLVDLRQIERLPLGFARRQRSQGGEKPGFQMVREFNRIAVGRNENLHRLAVFRRNDSLERVMVAIERLGEHRGRDVGLFDHVDRPAELGRNNLCVLDQLGRPPRDFERGVVGRMDRAEKIGRFEARFIDPPQEAIGIEEVVGARGLGRGEPLDAGERRALTGLGSRGLRRRKAQQADKPRAETGRQSLHHAHSFLRATSSIRWLAPLVRRRSARGRVGRIFSCRLTRLMRRQIDRAVASASTSSRSAY